VGRGRDRGVGRHRPTEAARSEDKEEERDAELEGVGGARREPDAERAQGARRDDEREPVPEPPRGPEERGGARAHGPSPEERAHRGEVIGLDGVSHPEEEPEEPAPAHRRAPGLGGFGFLDGARAPRASARSVLDGGADVGADDGVDDGAGDGVDGGAGPPVRARGLTSSPHLRVYAISMTLTSFPSGMVSYISKTCLFSLSNFVTPRDVVSRPTAGLDIFMVIVSVFVAGS